MPNFKPSAKKIIKGAIYLALVFSILIVVIIFIKINYLETRNLKHQYQKDSIQFFKSKKENFELIAKGTNSKAIGVGRIVNFAVANMADQFMFEIILGVSPKNIVFNQAEVPLGALEYQWEVYVDIDNDSIFESCFSVSHVKRSNLISTGNFFENTHLISSILENGKWVKTEKIPFSITLKKNVLVFVVSRNQFFKIRTGSRAKVVVSVEGKNESKDESTLFKIQ